MEKEVRYGEKGGVGRYLSRKNAHVVSKGPELDPPGPMWKRLGLMSHTLIPALEKQIPGTC